MCGNPLRSYVPISGLSDTRRADCRTCGTYEITYETAVNVRSRNTSPDARRRLSATTRTHWELRRKPLRLISTEVDHLIASARQLTPPEQAKVLLDYIERRSGPNRELVDIDAKKDYPIVWATDGGAIRFALEALRQEGLIKPEFARASDGITRAHYRLEMKGYERLETWRREHNGSFHLQSTEPAVVVMPPKLEVAEPSLPLKEDGTVAQGERDGTMDATGRKRVFIGHGRSQVWRELKDFLKERLGLEHDEFNRQPPAGCTTTERLEEMLNEADFALIVMTAEDEQPDGSVRARENVVHEAGLFQGKLGFKKAIILLEEGCTEFSNKLGLTHVPFQKERISTAFEEVRRVLEFHGVISAQGVAVSDAEDLVPRTRASARVDQGPRVAMPVVASTDDITVARKRAYTLAIGILRHLCGQMTSDASLPGALWHAKNPQWRVIAERLGEIESHRGRFRPHVEPSLFDGADPMMARAAQSILELYLWGATNYGAFEEVRKKHDLPEVDDVAALVNRPGEPLA